MGYTHYFEQGKPATKEQWDAITEAFKKIAPSLPIQREDDDPARPEITEDRIIFNGIGDNGHETMLLERAGHGFQFCKTARKPYDRAVITLLTIANNLAPGTWVISSDGSAKEWQPDIDWLNSQGIGEFELPPLKD